MLEFFFLLSFASIFHINLLIRFLLNEIAFTLKRWNWSLYSNRHSFFLFNLKNRPLDGLHLPKYMIMCWPQCSMDVDVICLSYNKNWRQHISLHAICLSFVFKLVSIEDARTHILPTHFTLTEFKVEQNVSSFLMRNMRKHIQFNQNTNQEWNPKLSHI